MQPQHILLWLLLADGRVDSSEWGTVELDALRSTTIELTAYTPETEPIEVLALRSTTIELEALRG